MKRLCTLTLAAGLLSVQPAGSSWWSPAPQTRACVLDTADFISAHNGVLAEWNQAKKLADAVPRMSQAPQIEKLQVIRSRLERLSPPECAKPVQEALVGAMDQSISTLMTFLADSSDQELTHRQVNLGLEKHKWNTAFAEFAKLMERRGRYAVNRSVDPSEVAVCRQDCATKYQGGFWAELADCEDACYSRLR